MQGEREWIVSAPLNSRSPLPHVRGWAQQWGREWIVSLLHLPAPDMGQRGAFLREVDTIHSQGGHMVPKSDANVVCPLMNT